MSLLPLPSLAPLAILNGTRSTPLDMLLLCKGWARLCDCPALYSCADSSRGIVWWQQGQGCVDGGPAHAWVPASLFDLLHAPVKSHSGLGSVGVLPVC